MQHDAWNSDELMILYYAIIMHVAEKPYKKSSS